MQKDIQQSSVISLDHVFFRYEDGKKVLEDITFHLNKGDFMGIVGPNGSGKSTLMKLILGLNVPSKGEINLFGQPLQKFKEWNKIGYVAQQAAHGASGFPATVREVVSSGLVGKVGMFRRLTAEHRQQVADVIERVGLSAKINERISNLSGGQLQRVFIARALVSEPELLILDEPTVGVDQESIQQFYELLRSLKDETGMTMVIVSHDVSVMMEWVNKVACLQRRLHFHGTTEEYEHNQEEIFRSMYGDSVRLLTHNH
ncbi:metal ABC transporter ATP-binding protein [Brevibacillus daliensis]|uniref:metal ABC transporter ATP-binding protein n=1 Tax=Brevibacillus daliensis TaxID=2892995 RepID=UPI001E4098C6|nr:metal ABC transporter ATP-binding protein [Brevibacillus daliensis]